jgi:tetratricopeptide (TPR) repeat protein
MTSKPPHPQHLLVLAGLLAVAGLSSPAWANSPNSAPIAPALSSKPSAAVLTQEAQKKLMRNFGTGQATDPIVMLQKGVSLMESNRTDEAIAALNKMASEYPQLPEPHNNLAVIYASKGQNDKARLALEAALRTHPAYAVAMENLSQMYARQAKEAYAKALPPASGPKAATVSPPSLTVMRHVVLPGLSVSPDLLAAVNNLTRPAPAASATVVVAVPATLPASKPASPAAIAAPPALAPTKPTVAAASAPAKPAATPPTTAAATPTPVPVPSTPDREAQQAATTQVRQAVAAWARAWSQQDMDAYFAAYTPEFDGGKNRKAWMDDRRNRIMGKKSIEVNVSGISVVMEGNAATAHFKQDYNAGELQVSSSKRLRFAKVGDRWLIDKESVGS